MIMILINLKHIVVTNSNINGIDNINAKCESIILYKTSSKTTDHPVNK